MLAWKWLMKLSRRAFSNSCAIAASGFVIGEELPDFGQLEGQHISSSATHPVPAIQDNETIAQKEPAIELVS